MKLLYINTYIPYPLNSGGSQAFFTITDYIRKHHELSLLLYVHNSTERRNVEKLRKLWPDVTFYTYEKTAADEDSSLADFSGMSWRDKTLCRMLNYFHASFGRKINRRRHKSMTKRCFADTDESAISKPDFVRDHAMLFMKTDDLTPGFCNYVKSIAANGFDVIQVEFYDYLPLVYFLPKETKKVFVHHEIRFVRNEIEYQLFERPVSTDLLLLKKDKAAELGALAEYDAVVTLTETDKAILSEYLPADKVFASPAITQTAAVEHKSFKPATELAFIGSGSHFPNADGVVWFCKEVVPVLRKMNQELPVVNITGSWKSVMKEELKKVCPTVNFVGYVDDLPSFLNGKISIVPIRIGSGMRMKILDSVFAAAPLVTTSKGCEGLPMENDKNCLIADTATDFAKAVSVLLADHERQRVLAHNAQEVDTGMLDETDLFRRRMAVYESIVR